ncbi:hypothetical protein [Amedibacillus dolichus]|uniref:hypothetical protein n=1 Tax=Amedibacillus dolichus TaxID=31971 RepID=UPI00242ACD3F|nr:hypothetical protein [Amedibacillus dolichus]
MGLVSIKDYAKNKGVTHQSVYQMMKTHEEELKDYIVKQGRTRYLTEEAIEILEKYSNVQVVIERAEFHEEIERLKEENRNLLIKVAAQADKIAELSEWKSDHAVMIAEANQNKLLLEEKTKQFDELKADNRQLTDELAITKQELEHERNKGFFAKLFGGK